MVTYLTDINGAGIDLEKPLAVHCYNGVSACLVPVALSQLKEPTQLSIYVVGGSILSSLKLNNDEKFKHFSFFKVMNIKLNVNLNVTKIVLLFSILKYAHLIV
jgi:hypothetical protein